MKLNNKPAKNRLMRQSRSIEQDGASYSIVRSPDGGPLRTFSGGLAHENGWYASRKAGRLLHWEGVTQLAYLIRAEVDFTVNRVGTECVRFEFLASTGMQQYTADVEEIGADGSISVIEIKRDAGDLGDPEYAEKLTTVGKICQSKGYNFNVVFKDQIWSSSTHRRNATLFASRAFVRTTHEHLRRLEAHGARTDCRSGYGALVEALEPHSRRAGEAVLQALVVARRVEIDLTQLLLDSTPVTIH